ACCSCAVARRAEEGRNYNLADEMPSSRRKLQLDQIGMPPQLVETPSAAAHRRIHGGAMSNKDLYTVREAMERLGGISRNTIYNLLRDGRLASASIGKRRFIPAHAIDEFIHMATTTESPSLCGRSKRATQIPLRLAPAAPIRSR